MVTKIVLHAAVHKEGRGEGLGRRLLLLHAGLLGDVWHGSVVPTLGKILLLVQHPYVALAQSLGVIDGIVG